MTNHATPEERDAHAARLKLADQKWAELQPTRYENADDTAKWYWTVGFVRGLEEAQTEIDHLREAIRRLADQDATLSVCDGNVTVTMDATLNDAEREVLGWLRRECKKQGWDDWADVVGDLLKRTTGLEHE